MHHTNYLIILIVKIAQQNSQPKVDHSISFFHLFFCSPFSPHSLPIILTSLSLFLAHTPPLIQ